MRQIAGLLIALLLGWAPAAAAQDEPRIEPLSSLDRQYMARQRQAIEDLALRSLGRGISGDTERDLELLQALLDRQLVSPDQTQELQAMGFVLGDLLAAELDMHWVVYLDKAGRSRALRYRETDSYLFPVTMISRRREVGDTTPVREIYRKAHAIIDEVRPPLPFE